MIPEKPLHVSVSCKRAIRILATPGLDICLSGLDRSSLPRRLDQAVRRDRRDKSVNRADPLHLHHPLLLKTDQLRLLPSRHNGTPRFRRIPM
jgi:hypothetical protein